jgi:hypothetical protein
VILIVFDEGVMGFGILYEQTLDGQPQKCLGIDEKWEKHLKSLIQITTYPLKKPQ